MNTDHFVKVFDLLDAGFRAWTFSAFGLIFVAAGLLVAVWPKFIKATGIPYLKFRSDWGAFSRYGMLGFAILWTAVTFIATYSVHLRHTALVQENRCRVVEGAVDNFVPMPSAGHARESFTVSGVPFSYSDFAVTDGFNNTPSHGGPLNSGSYVRICYDPSDNAILRLEIRDFAGDPKDYAQGWSFFPTPPDVQHRPGTNPPVKAPWYANLPFVLVALDFIAIQALFLPYLRTFFRLRTTAVRDWPIPATLEPGKKIKLRNSMMYWDGENRAIWLRPRGLNLVRAPLMAAMLNVDASGGSISEVQIRFSSGFPFVVVLFLGLTYLSLSVIIPRGNFPSPELIVGIFASMALVVFFFGLRIYRSRMEDVVQDALSELKEMSGPWHRLAQRALA